VISKPSHWTPDDAFCGKDKSAAGEDSCFRPRIEAERPQKTAAAGQRAGLQQRPALSDMFRSRAVRSDRRLCIQPSVGAC
jgi:hypothetical protein